jgi:SNF2 family DNA or RNA helicase
VTEHQFKTAPYDHQRNIFTESRNLPAYALFLDLGTGKSHIVVNTAAWLYTRGEIDGLLVVAPKGVYSNWVDYEIPKHAPDEILEEARIVLWQSGTSNKAYRDGIGELFELTPRRLHVLVMNIEALNTRPAFTLAAKFLKFHSSLMVVDESSAIKNPKAKWTQRVTRLGKAAKYRRILTGTPITNSPLDAYSQFEFLDPSILGFSSYYGFRNRYALVRRRRINTHAFDEVVGYQRLDELHAKITSSGVILKKEECLDLPDKIYLSRRIELSPRQRKIYDQLKKMSVAELDGTGVVTVELALTKLLRLHQITCGFVPVSGPADALDATDEVPRDTERWTAVIDPGGGPRQRELLALLEETSGKVIIWANYTYNIDTIYETLCSAYGAGSVGRFYGATSEDDRKVIISRFQDPKSDLRFFVGQPRSGGYGLTLTEAKTVVYFSNNYSLESRLQSEDRAHRIGQTSNVTYVDIVASNTVDEKITKCLRDKKNLADLVMGGGWREFFED